MSDAEARAPRRHRLGLVLAVGLALRLTSILSLPLFNDEAIYGLWVRSILGRREWLIPLTDGKLPLFYWLGAFTAGLVNDPLMGLRVTAAFTGLVGITGAYLAAKELAGRRAGLAAAWIYAVAPYMVMHDRLGLPDGLVAALGPFVLWAAVRLGRAPDWRRTAILAAALGAALLAKTTGILLVLTALVGIDFGFRNAGDVMSDDDESLRAGRRLWVVVAAAAALAGALVPTAAILAVAPGGMFVVAKSSNFLLTLGELKDVPYTQWLNNVALLTRWLINYMQLPVLAVIGATLVLGEKSLKGRVLLALAAAAGPLAFMVLAARTWFSRYSVMAVPFIALAAGLAYVALREGPALPRLKRWAPVVLVIITVVAVSQDMLLIVSPPRFAWTKDDRWQYISGWPSGYGFDDAFDYLRHQSEIAGPGGLTVLVDENMGFPLDGLRLRMTGQEIRVTAVNGRKRPPADAIGRGRYLYIADVPRLNKEDFAKDDPLWTEAAAFAKPGNRSSFVIYRLKNPRQ